MGLLLIWKGVLRYVCRNKYALSTAKYISIALDRMGTRTYMKQCFLLSSPKKGPDLFLHVYVLSFTCAIDVQPGLFHLALHLNLSEDTSQGGLAKGSNQLVCSPDFSPGLRCVQQSQPVTLSHFLD